MAKPNHQAGHGPVGGTEDESAFAHREAAGSDAEDGHEADWDVPASPDNSTLSRILGLVLVVVLAGVFSFVAYRKYQEAKHNPAALTVDATAPGTDGTPGEQHADAGGAPGNSPFDNEPNANAHEHAHDAVPGGAPTAPGTAGVARLGGSSADAFGSLDEPGPNPAEHNRQPNHPGAGSVALTRAGHSAPAGGQQAEANPFGDLNSQPERRPQQPPAQSEPGQPVAGGPSGAGLPPSAGTPRAPVAKTDDMQNLFPDENAGRKEPPGQNPQRLAGRENPLEPAGLAKTAQVANQIAPNNAGRTPPPQNEPLDNELDERARAATHPTQTGNGALVGTGAVHMRQDSHAPGADGLTPRIEPAGTPIQGAAKVGRAEALLAGADRGAKGDDSPFGGEPPAGGNPRVGAHAPSDELTPQPRAAGSVSLNASSRTLVQNGEPRPTAGADDPFGGNRSVSGAGAAGERFSPAATAENPLAQPTRGMARPGTAIPSTVSPVGTTSDTGEFYVVEPQDNFWTISRKKYGTSRYFQALAEVNKARIPDPARMRPGMKVSTPPADVLEERYAQFMPPGTRVQKTSAEDLTAKSAPTGFFIAIDGTAKYRTGEHDTLSEIASKHLGRSSRWIQIYEMNRDKLSNPNQVKVGIELTLPGDASSVGVSSEADDRR